MGLKAKIEAVIYAAEEPITLEQISLLVKDIVLAEEAEKARADSIAEIEPLESMPAPEEDGAPASDASEPAEPAPSDDASNGTAVSQPVEFAEESAAEVQPRYSEKRRLHLPKPQRSQSRRQALPRHPRAPVSTANPPTPRTRA